MASSADETADPDPKAHCHDRSAGRGYRSPRDDQRESLDPCRFCFPNGEIDVDEDEILVSQSRKSDAKLHRVAGSDGTTWKPTNYQDTDVTRALHRDDITSIEELAEFLEEVDDGW